MLLRIVKANHFYNFLLIPLLSFLFLLLSIVNGGIYPAEQCSYTSPVCEPLMNSGIPYWGAILLNYFVVLIICFLLLQINAKFAFVKERTFLPAFLFPVIVYALPELRVIQPIFISTIFMILAIRSIFNSFEQKSAIKNGFDAGIFLGIAGIFYFYSIFYILLIPISISILRNHLKWREAIAPFIGLLLPWIFLFSIYFITDHIPTLFDYIGNTFTLKEKSFQVHLPIQIYFTYLILIITIASLFILKQYGVKNINVRRYFKILFLFFIVSSGLLFSPHVSSEILVFLSIPLTFLLTNYLIFVKRRIWAELFLIILVIISVSIQFFVNG
ncbi:MAG: DUF6427 family protein [Prolixibacteraceae bacterium]